MASRKIKNRRYDEYSFQNNSQSGYIDEYNCNNSSPLSNVYQENSINLLHEYVNLTAKVTELRKDVDNVKALTLRSNEFYRSATSLQKLCRVILLFSPLINYGIFALFLWLVSDKKYIQIITGIFAFILGILSIVEILYIAISEKKKNDEFEGLKEKVELLEKKTNDDDIEIF